MKVKKSQYLAALQEELTFCPLDINTLQKLSLKLYDDPHYYCALFFDGIDDVVHGLQKMLDEDMTQTVACATGGVTSKVKQAVLMRLDTQGNNIATNRALYDYYLRHGKLLAMTRAAWNTADSIWYAIGDRSTDWNYYSKRTILATIYLATLKDRVDERSDTEARLDARLHRIKVFSQARYKTEKILAKIPILRMFLRN